MYYSKLCNLRFFIIQLVDRYNSFGKSVKIKIKILIFLIFKYSFAKYTYTYILKPIFLKMISIFILVKVTE